MSWGALIVGFCLMVVGLAVFVLALLGLWRLVEALARAISTDANEVKQGHVWHWLNKGKHVPAEYCGRIEAATGVSCHQLRPDVFPAPSNDTTPDQSKGAAA